jgi:hypothetical protein
LKRNRIIQNLRETSTYGDDGGGRFIEGRRTAIMTAMIEQLFKERGILEESSQLERAGGEFCTVLDRHRESDNDEGEYVVFKAARPA